MAITRRDAALQDLIGLAYHIALDNVFLFIRGSPNHRKENVLVSKCFKSGFGNDVFHPDRSTRPEKRPSKKANAGFSVSRSGNVIITIAN